MYFCLYYQRNLGNKQKWFQIEINKSLSTSNFFAQWPNESRNEWKTFTTLTEAFFPYLALNSAFASQMAWLGLYFS